MAVLAEFAYKTGSMPQHYLSPHAQHQATPSCHNPFPTLVTSSLLYIGPIRVTLPTPQDFPDYQLHMNQFQVVPDWTLGLHFIAPSSHCQNASRNSCTHLRECRAFQDHMGDMTINTNHMPLHHLVRQSLKPLDLGTEGPNPLLFPIYFYCTAC